MALRDWPGKPCRNRARLALSARHISITVRHRKAGALTKPCALAFQFFRLFRSPEPSDARL